MTTELLSLEELRGRLADAQNSFEMAKFIDSFPRMQRERNYWADQIRTLTSKIRAMESGQ